LADKYLNENGTDRFLLEDGSGLYLLEVVDHPLTAAAGSYSIAGAAATLVRGRALSGGAVAGSYSITGAAATLTYGVETRWYLRAASTLWPIPPGERSEALPSSGAVSVKNSGAAYESLALETTKGVSEALVTISSSATQSLQHNYVARFVSDPLAAQTIPAKTWTLAIATSEDNPSANSFSTPCVYVWNPRTFSAKYIYDSETPLGVEWFFTEDGQVLTFSGASIKVEDGDVIVLEIWRAASQVTATSYVQTVYFNGTTDVTDATTIDAASYLSVPVSIRFRWS